MKKITVAILLGLCCAACFAKQHKSKKNRKAARVISVESFHTACYGRCPVYKIKVDEDGTATYTGILFTNDSGVYKKNIGKAKARDILNRFTDYMADTCQDLYKKRAEDLPGTVLTIKYAGKTKMIQNSQLGPVGLRELNASVDNMAIGKLDNTWRLAEAGEK